MKALITRKVGMTSTINDDGVVQAVTLLSARPCVVTQIKTDETDGYTAIQIGADIVKTLSKSQTGHLKPSKTLPKIVREFATQKLEEELKVGDFINADVFVPGDVVTATGISKGKGFAGTIKRHNFHRQRKTHGGKGNTRKPGSIGSMYPQHILKGRKMAGRMGADRVTVRNLKVAFVDMDLGVIGLTGAVPGPRKGVVLIRGID